MTTGPDQADLTARARIRNAAMQHFGEHGFERATVRGIAETAGVSSGLVRHHFGSKQELREACDAHLVKLIRQLNDRVRAENTTSDLQYMAAARTSLGQHQRYLVRALVEGAAAPLFDEMVGIGADYLATADARRADPPDVDRRVRAALITAMALAVPMLHEHLSRAVGLDLTSPEGEELLARALIDIYSHPMLSPEDAAWARAGLDRIRNDSPADRAAALRRVEEHSDE